MIKRMLAIWLPACLTAAALSGCGSSARYIEPGGEEALITVSAVDPAEWKPVVMIGRLRNYTLLHLESALLTNQMRQAILASGQAKVTSATGYGGNLDRSVRRVRELENDDLFDQASVVKRGTVIAPNFSLAGTIIQQSTFSGNTEESYYMFHLTLTDLKSGVAVWEKNIDFAKQATKPIL